MRTARLIIYDGPEDWMETQRGRDLRTPYVVSKGGRILSVEIDPDTFMLTENYNEVNMGTLIINYQKIEDIRLGKE